MPTSHRINKYLPPPLAPYPGFSDLLTALQCTVVKLTSLVIIVACWQETILLMMSTTPASLYALVINALLFIGFYTKMRCPQIALTFSGDSSFKVQLLFIKTSQGCSECDLVCQFVICRFILYPTLWEGFVKIKQSLAMDLDDRIPKQHSISKT